jgi:hypothetical protein
MKRERMGRKRRGTWGKGLGFWSNPTWENIQILRFSIFLKY